MKPASVISDPPTILCIRCRYNLHGLPAGSRCPECGLPIYWSTRAPRKLSEFPGGWVASMSRGVRSLALAYAETFAFFVILSLDIFPHTPAGEFDLQTLGIVVLISAALLQCHGMWMLSRSSGHHSEPRAIVIRWVLRIAPLGGMLAVGAFIWLLQQFNPMQTMLINAGLIVEAAAPTAVFVRLRTIARLISDAGLAEYSAIVGIGFAATAFIFAAVMFLNQHYDLQSGVAIAATILAVGLPTLLFLLWGAYTLVICVIDFGRAAKVVRAQWIADSAAV